MVDERRESASEIGFKPGGHRRSILTADDGELMIFPCSACARVATVSGGDATDSGWLYYVVASRNRQAPPPGTGAGSKWAKSQSGLEVESRGRGACTFFDFFVF